MPFDISTISDRVLAFGGFLGGLVSSVFLSPPRYVWGVGGLVVTVGCLGVFMKRRWVESSPNEWLLIIRDGKCIKSGVGLKCFLGLIDSHVTFPSKVEQVSFNANNVTKEMQGVDITGFVFWSVYRDEDGPFRCYKYMQGGDANRNVQAICESSLRNLIANSSLDEVMKNRNHLRDQMKAELKDQFKGWGIWLESVEITEVKICSDKLFKDLQAEFRQETQLKAQRIELENQQRINETRQENNLKITQANETNETKQIITKNAERIKRDSEQAKYETQKNELELKRIEREAKFQIEKMKKDLEQEQTKLANEQTIAKIKQEFELQYLKSRIDLDKLHDEKTLQKYQIDVTERIYNKLGIKEIKINQFIGDTKSSLSSILPQMGFAMGQLNAAQQ